MAIYMGYTLRLVRVLGGDPLGKSSKRLWGLRGVLEALDAVFDFLCYVIVLIDVLKVPCIVLW